ncbi:tRNA-dihydrouridine synthase 1 [Microsporum canis CBS 113480]|uniref:tRNA-dihydrouridine synthase 1 n=1 Tax=Arthroderma otae (strain ATCC MYA-4605 / CBS 113480) TaxID=554155 RepID=C5FBD9_ARTOC|nr:tRNA-dihydrouridine synthase 1 [Microsporum canis CBS 113480]EEQ27123.1 tRNA-dihydrouridine synthase 1 [Microsporum canis CBS 113480]
MSSNPQQMFPDSWIHEQEFREQVEAIVTEERRTSGKSPTPDDFIHRPEFQELVKTALESVQELYPQNLLGSQADGTQSQISTDANNGNVEVDEKQIDSFGLDMIFGQDDMDDSFSQESQEWMSQQHHDDRKNIENDEVAADDRASSDAAVTATEPYLDGNPKYDRPLIVQFCANNPDELLRAARHVEGYCDAEDPDLIYKLINKLHAELSIPVTAKFRILETKEKTLEYAKMILSAGASILSVHGRRREQKGHNTGVANWEYIRYLRDNLPPETVIFANGNILNHGDIRDCLESTGADGVMSAEGNLSDPTIFSTPPPPGSEGRIYWRGRDGRGGYRLDYVLRQYIDLIYKYVLEQEPPQREPLYHPDDPALESSSRADEAAEDEAQQPPRKKQKQGRRMKKATSTNLTTMQGHLFQLLRHLISHRTDIRDALARCHGGDMPQFEKVVRLVDQAVKQGMQEYEQNPSWQHITPASKPGVVKSEESKATMEKYQRPWWVCQPFIRPLPEEALQIGSLQLKKKDIPAEGTYPIPAQVVTEIEDESNGNGTDTLGSVDDASESRKLTITPSSLVSG